VQPWCGRSSAKPRRKSACSQLTAHDNAPLAASQGRGGDGVPPGRKLRSRCAARVRRCLHTAARLAQAPDALQNDAPPAAGLPLPQRSTLAAAGEAEDVLFASGQPEQCAPRRRAARGLRAAARLG
jgi:hypothetical protein